MNRIAGAPISWGVCEVPGWGFQLGSQQVLTEMREVGLTATELGPTGSSALPTAATSSMSTACRPSVDSPSRARTRP